LTSVSGTPCLAISDGMELTNAVFSVWQTAPLSGTYRNYNAPIPTDLPEEDLAVPDFAAWRLRITGPLDNFIIEQAAVTTTVDRVEQITFINDNGSLLSEQKFILIPNRTLEAPVPPEYTPLEIDDTAVRWQDTDAVDVSALVCLGFEMPTSRSGANGRSGVGVRAAGAAQTLELTADQKAKLGAIVIQSLDRKTKGWQDLNPEKYIAKPLEEMGYPVTREYKAKTSKLSDYIKGKQIWYSMSHGGTYDADSKRGGKPWHPFTGLVFEDGKAIRASDLSSLNLNFKLAVVDACSSAQTSLQTQLDACHANKLLPHAQAFANAFGANVAYMGWAWEVNPGVAQTSSSKFINNLKFDPTLGKGRTVHEACLKFYVDNSPYPPSPNHETRLMKIHGAIETIIDPKTKE